MMHVVIFTCALPREGGVTSFINALASALQQAGCRATIMNPLGTGSQMQVLPAQTGSIVHKLLYWGPAYLAAYMAAQKTLSRRLARLLTEDPPDCWHANDVAAALAAPPRVPLLLTVHGYLTQEVVDRGIARQRSLLQRYLLRQEVQGYLRASQIAAVDAQRAHHVRALAGDLPTYVQPNGVDTTRFSPIGPGRKEWRARWGAGDDDLVILCPRHLEERYGIMDLFAAVMSLDPKFFRRIRLVYTGSGPLKGHLEKAITTAGMGEQIRLSGVIPYRDMPSLYRAADLVAVPSVGSATAGEGSPMAVLEAMATGKPVLASRVGGIPEQVADGSSGLLVPPNDPPALARAIGHLLTEPHLLTTLGAAGLRRAQEYFSIKALANSYMRLYLEVTGHASA